MTQPAAMTEEFGRLADGRAVDVITLCNRAGMRVRVLTLGATLQTIEVPGPNARLTNMILGYPTAQDYADDRFYMGATVGRCANRIAGGACRIDGESFTLARNNGPNHLHGGTVGFDKRLWSVGSVGLVDDAAHATIHYESQDGEEGYPGRLSVTAQFVLDQRNTLTIRYRARTTAPTIVNLTSHAYFNLTGDSAASVLDHRLLLHARSYTPVNAAMIPTGRIDTVAGTPYDFRTAKPIRQDIGADHTQIVIAGGYDHNFAIDGAPGELRPAALLTEPRSGRSLAISASAPGVQLYSANFLDIAHGHAPRTGLCIEPQFFPDSINRPAFSSPILRPGETYRSDMAFSFF